MASDEKAKQPQGNLHRWIGVSGLVLLTCGLAAHKRGLEARQPARKIPPPADHILAMMEDEEAEESVETLEDALAKLEGVGHGRKAQKAHKEDVEEHRFLEELFDTLFSPPAEPTKRSKGRKAKKGRRSSASLGTREMIKETVREMEARRDAHPEDVEAEESLWKEIEEDAAKHEKYHQDFAELVQKEAAHTLGFNMTEVKKDFQKAFKDDAASLLCQGCKLVAERLTSELAQHNVHEQEYPVLMFKQKRVAMDATCNSFKYLRVVSDQGGNRRFEAHDPSSGSHAEDLQHGQRLCQSLLEGAKFDLLTKMIQKKVPTYSDFYESKESGDNWERFLCAQHSRVCKRSEVREDDEDVEDEL